SNKTRVVKTTVPTDSFFQFFNPPAEPEDDNEDDDDNLDERLEMDYQIGEDIKEKLIPRAIDWYTDILRYHLVATITDQTTFHYIGYVIRWWNRMNIIDFK
ncbi:16636_t:CDS:2, partial [Dentiscutata erythropus]